jgi:hypothetical protein
VVLGAKRLSTRELEIEAEHHGARVWVLPLMAVAARVSGFTVGGVPVTWLEGRGGVCA